MPHRLLASLDEGVQDIGYDTHLTHYTRTIALWHPGLWAIHWSPRHSLLAIAINVAIILIVQSLYDYRVWLRAQSLPQFTTDADGKLSQRVSSWCTWLSRRESIFLSTEILTHETFARQQSFLEPLILTGIGIGEIPHQAKRLLAHPCRPKHSRMRRQGNREQASFAPLHAYAHHNAKQLDLPSVDLPALTTYGLNGLVRDRGPFRPGTRCCEVCLFPFIPVSLFDPIRPSIPSVCLLHSRAPRPDVFRFQTKPHSGFRRCLARPPQHRGILCLCQGSCGRSAGPPSALNARVTLAGILSRRLCRIPAVFVLLLVL
ncbi:hypothetical protein C8R47DRAFT_1202154 [Mycena vitilis]|nr:hypothetical protein C8R47DRAFT_1202154 [Mycena vitilis]